MKRLNLSKILVIIIVSSILFTSIMISSLWIYYTYSDFQTDSAVAEKLYIGNKEELLKQRIDAIVAYVNERRKEWEEIERDRVINKASSGYIMAKDIYDKYKGKKSNDYIKKFILSFFDSFKSCKNGCFFIYDLKSKEVYKNKQWKIPKMVLSRIEKEKKQKLFVSTYLKNKEAMWYVKYFKPFDWYIGYIKFLNESQDKLKRNIINYLASYKFKHNKHGYIFVSKLLNPQGGNCFARVLVNPNRPDIVGKCLSDNSVDLQGKYFRRKYLKDLKDKGYSLIEYEYKIPGTDKFGEKISYMVLYKPWNWIIGTGYYLTDLKQYFLRFKMKEFEKTLYKKITVIIVISIVILFLLMFVYLSIYNILRKDVQYLEDFFKKYPEIDRINVEGITTEDVYKIAEKINYMAEKIDMYSKSLKESFEKYRGLMSYMPDCVAIYRNRNGEIVVEEINSCIETLFHKTRDELIGKSVDVVFKDIPNLVQKVHEVFKSKITVESVDCIKRTTESEAERYCSCIVYSLEDGTVVSILKDVTDRVLLFKQIEARQRQVEKFINTINAGIIVNNEQGEIVYINDMAKKILELDKKPSKRELLRILGSKNIVGLKNKLRVLNSEDDSRCQNCSIKILTKNNKEKWLDLSIGNIEFDGKHMFVASFYDVTKRYLKEKEIEYISFHDSLTGLYNRRYFEEELNRLFKTRNYPLSLVIYDLNGLKIVNDVLGHKAGDNLLKKFGKILMSSSRASDVAARIGGDEFAVIMPNTDKNGVNVFIKRVEYKIEELNSKEKGVHLSVSCGYAVQNGKLQTIDELFSLADSAMYKNKYSDKNISLDKIIESVRRIKESNT